MTAVGKGRERIIWLVLLLAILVGSAIIIKTQGTLKNANQTIKQLEEEKTSWAQKEVDLTTEITGLKTKFEKQTEDRNEDSETDQIEDAEHKDTEQKEDGLKYDEFKEESEQIIQDLLKRNELIPHEGVLGGEMAFRKENTYVISDRWVFAYFEDGHINGNMLLSYNIKDGKISWKVIDSYLLGN